MRSMPASACPPVNGYCTRRGTGCCRRGPSGIVVGSLFHQVKPAKVHSPAGPETRRANDRLRLLVAPLPLRWQVYRDPQSRTIPSSSSSSSRYSSVKSSSVASEGQERKPAKQAPSLGRPDTGRLAVSPACRSMQDKLMWPLPLPRKAAGAIPPGHATSDQRYFLL